MIGSFDLEWKVVADDIEKVFESEAQTTSTELVFKKFLNHLLRCKSQTAIKDVKIFQKQENVFLKGKCIGFRKHCIINLLDDGCQDNSLIEDFVNQQMFAISSSFDYEIELSVSFDFDADNIDIVPGFISEIIEGGAGSQRAMSNSALGLPDVNNEALLTIQKNGTDSKMNNEAFFKQSGENHIGSIGLSTEVFTITESNQADASRKNPSDHGTTSEKSSIETIFAFYGLDFDNDIDVCFWDEINCIDDSVTQIFIRKY